MTIFFGAFDRIARFFRKTDVKQPRKLGDDTRVRTLLVYFPDFRQRIESRFGILLTTQDESLTLKAFTQRHGLPTPSVLYMALRLDQRFANANGIAPEEVRRWRSTRPDATVVDCRESWELAIPGIEGARAMDENTLNALTKDAAYSAPLLLYCHHGLRSADVAAHLADQGFTNVRWIVGGLDRYAATVDRSIERYEAPPC